MFLFSKLFGCSSGFCSLDLNSTLDILTKKLYPSKVYLHFKGKLLPYYFLHFMSFTHKIKQTLRFHTVNSLLSSFPVKNEIPSWEKSQGHKKSGKTILGKTLVILFD